MWPDDIESKQVNHFIIFKKINKSNISYNELTQFTAPSPAHFPGIYAIKDAFKKIVKNSIMGKKTIPRKRKPKSFDFTKISNIVAKKYKSEVTRHKRDPKLVKELKKSNLILLHYHQRQLFDLIFFQPHRKLKMHTSFLYHLHKPNYSLKPLKQIHFLFFFLKLL